MREIVVDGRTFYGRVVDKFTAGDASAHNLGLVADALEQAGISYFLVPGRSGTRHILGVQSRRTQTAPGQRARGP
ncbi:hypothetical protein [Streptomyces gobiensis]|uniref:hypothetical protein n=1 Tax=Streptomyces gobiensis TaxID=2875706 RepID=UPI001E52B2BF|nr:hypothetical protein [Streptomyces gobiensis]UGY94232.1 hypothetical protein test1122_22545 [Streptomyces gobiensis]